MYLAFGWWTQEGVNNLFIELKMKGMRYLQWSDLVSDLNSLQSAATKNINIKWTTFSVGVVGAETITYKKVQTQTRTARGFTVWRDGERHNLQQILMWLGENHIFYFLNLIEGLKVFYKWKVNEPKNVYW